MGRRREAATVVCGGDTSSSSAETSFRELDDVLLQTKTRIWLSQVLKRTLEEDVLISNLLADGELLFEVSKLLWNMLLVKFADIRTVKAYPCSSLSRRRGGRYMPYSNVDSFLKVCKVLGLNGIDLFSPSDVVEKRDIRKVCICIRALSKKARSKQLNVPDFDGVSHDAVMPKDMVGYIRRSLETSKCSSSSYSSRSSCKVKRSKIQRKKNILDYDDDSDSDKSDEAESKYLALETERSCENNFDNPQNLDFSDSVLGTDDSIPTLFDEEETVWNFLKSIECDQSESSQRIFKNSYNEKRLEDMEDVEVSSTVSMNSIVGRVLNVDFDDPFDIGECSIVKGHSTEPLEYDFDCRDRSSIGYNQPQDFPHSDTMSNSSDTEAKESEFELKLEHEGFCLELLSTYQDHGGPIMTESQGLEFASSAVHPRDEKIENMANEKEIEIPENLASKLHPPDCRQNTNGDIAISSPHHEILVESVIACTEFSVEGGQSCSCSSPCPGEVLQDTPCQREGSTSSSGPNQDVGSLENEDEGGPLGKPPNFLAEASVDAIEAFGPACIDDPNDVVIHGCEEKSEKEEGGEHEYPETLGENIIDGMKGQSDELEAKPRQRPLLKNVVRGTALIGVLCFLLHISRRGQEKTGEPAKQSSRTLKSGNSKSSLQKEQPNIRGNSAYPVEKLKFGK